MKKYSFYKNWPESCVHDLHLAIIVFIRFGLGNISLVTVFDDLFSGRYEEHKTVFQLSILYERME